MVDLRNASPGSYGPSGYGAEGREQSRVAPDPGRGGVRSNWPGAPNPAGWSPSPAGEAAPPVRHRGPARSDAPSPYDVETRPTAIYQIPWRSPHRIPVVGPVEALRGPAANRMEAPRIPAATPGMVPPGAVPVVLGQGSSTGWQLAQRAWEDSGVTWEAPPEPRTASAFAPASPFAPAPAFAATPLSAPAAPPLSEPDELFRAWQGSVDAAAGRRAPRAARRRVRANRAGTRGRGWQAAKIGVPAAVIVTVGAGALMMLTGQANQMLAERASSGALSSGKPASGPVASGQTSVGLSPLARTDTLTLAGYPAEHGSVGVAAMWSADGITMAVGYADGHPAVWRHAADGSWSLVSTAVLGGVTGHLTAVAQGPSGWIAVGSVQANGVAEPAVFTSADGVTWQQMTGLTTLAGGNAQFLGVAAGRSGYLVVGKQGTGGQRAVALWWSGDLKNWVNGASSGPAGSVATAAVATTAGFVAVGSENGCHTFWTSADGQRWTAHDLAKPNGASAATFTSVAAGQGGQADRFVAAGVATTSAGDLPIVVTAANDGTHISQTVLSSAGGPGAATAVTATASGFLAVGTAGPANAHHAVTWTSTEGRIWTPAAPLPAAGNSEITALATPSTGTTLTATAQQGASPAIFTFPAP